MSDSLRELQLRFASAIREGGKEIHKSIQSDDSGDAETRVGIYSDAYQLRLLEALETDFTGLHSLLGDEQFETLGRDYIAAHPSVFPSVRWFAGKLPEYLKQTPRYAEQAVIIEMGEFEWAKCASFDAPDSEIFTIELLALISPELWGEMTFEFSPTVQRLDLRTNTPALWLAFEQESEVPEINTEENPTGWAMWRKQLDPHWRSLEVDEAWALDQAMQGANFAYICEGLCEWVDPEHAAMRAVSFIKTWLTDEMISGIKT